MSKSSGAVPVVWCCRRRIHQHTFPYDGIRLIIISALPTWCIDAHIVETQRQVLLEYLGDHILDLERHRIAFAQIRKEIHITAFDLSPGSLNWLNGFFVVAFHLWFMFKYDAKITIYCQFNHIWITILQRNFSRSKDNERTCKLPYLCSGIIKVMIMKRKIFMFFMATFAMQSFTNSRSKTVIRWHDNYPAIRQYSLIEQTETTPYQCSQRFSAALKISAGAYAFTDIMNLPAGWQQLQATWRTTCSMPAYRWTRPSMMVAPFGKSVSPKRKLT